MRVVIILAVYLTALGRTIGLVVTWWRPRRAEHNAATLLHDLRRGQRALPVVGRVIVVPFRHDHIANEVRRNLHTHDVQPYLRRRTVEQLHGLRVRTVGTHRTVAAGGAESRHRLIAGCAHRQSSSCGSLDSRRDDSQRHCSDYKLLHLLLFLAAKIQLYRHPPQLFRLFICEFGNPQDSACFRRLLPN